MMAGIVNSRQNSPVDFFFELVDKFDHPAGGTNAQRSDFDNSFVLSGPFDESNLIVESSLTFPRPFQAG